MPRPKKNPPDKLEYNLPVLFSLTDKEIIEKYTRAHGCSRAEAVRQLMRKGAELEGLFTPK